MEYSENGNFIVSGSEDATLRLWHLRDPSLHRRFTTYDRVFTISVSTDSRFVAAGSADGMVWVWGVSTQSVILSFQAHNNSVCSIQFLPTEMDLVSASFDGLAKRWEFIPRFDESGAEQIVEKCSATFKGHQARAPLLSEFPTHCNRRIRA
jgi:general transcriptional corepressor TUP1